MDIGAIIQLLTGSPLAIVLLYLLIKAQQETADIRRERDNDARQWVERFAALAEKVSDAIDKVEPPWKD